MSPKAEEKIVLPRSRTTFCTDSCRYKMAKHAYGSPSIVLRSTIFYKKKRACARLKFFLLSKARGTTGETPVVMKIVNFQTFRISYSDRHARALHSTPRFFPLCIFIRCTHPPVTDRWYTKYQLTGVLFFCGQKSADPQPESNRNTLHSTHGLPGNTGTAAHLNRGYSTASCLKRTTDS